MKGEEKNKMKGQIMLKIKNIFAEILENGTKKSKNSRLRMKIIAEFKKRNSKKKLGKEKEKKK